MIVYNSNRFTYNRQAKQFTAVASQLTYNGRAPLFSRMPNSAMSAGLMLSSSRTGVKVRYEVKHIECRENDIQWWDLHPLADDNATAGGTTIRIYND